MYIDFRGQTRLCGWTNGAPIGYVTQEGVEKLWNSEAAKAVRQGGIDGTFSRCRREMCPLLHNDLLPEIPDATMEELTTPYPEEISLGYDYRCNLACPSCRKDFIHGSPNADAFFDEMYDTLVPYLDNAKHLMFGAHNEAFYGEHVMRILSNLRPKHPDLRLSFCTNGLLFTPSLWKRIEHLGKYHIHMDVSIDSINPDVYAQLRRGGKFSQLEKNLRFMAELRREKVINFMGAVMVVQDLNFMEIPHFTKYCLELGFDQVNLESIYDWGTLTEKEYYFKNLLNPQHPNHKLFRKLADEARKDKRVLLWTGDANKPDSYSVVLGQSRLAVVDVAPNDVVDADIPFSALGDAIYNKGYVFVIEGGEYRGMIRYADFHAYNSSADCVPCTAEALCCPEMKTISQTDIGAIFADKESLLASKDCQSVYPVLDGNRLVAKLLIA